MRFNVALSEHVEQKSLGSRVLEKLDLLESSARTTCGFGPLGV